MNKVIIYGKDTWPYTNNAREAYKNSGKEIDYISVIDDPLNLDEMLKHSDGARKVPVIIEDGKVTIGYNGGSWGV